MQTRKSKRSLGAFGVAFVGLSCAGATATPARAQAPTPAPAPGRNGKAAILYQGDVGLTVVPPPGWVLDDVKGRALGALAVLYPQGKTWASSEVVMYINIIRHAKNAPQAFARAVADDVSETRRRTPSVRAVKGAPGRTRDNRETVTYTFDADGPKPTCDAIAYQATPSGLVLIAVSARSLKAREASRPAWEGLTNSMVYVRIEPKGASAKPAPKP